MTLHFIQLKLGNRTYSPTQVSTEGCSNVDDFRDAIKTKFSPVLDPYALYHFTLLQPDGTTEIDPQTPVADLKEIPSKPMVATVQVLPTPASTGSSKKQLVYRGVSSEASRRKFLEALAIESYFEYDFPKTNLRPTMDDLLAARDGQFGKPKEEAKGVAWWDYKKGDGDGVQYTEIPLPSRLSVQQWDILKSLNRETTKRIHDAHLPLTSRQKPFIILPHTKFIEIEYVEALKNIAAVIGIIYAEDDLVVKDESDL